MGLGWIADEAMAIDRTEKLGIDAEDGLASSGVGGGFVFTLAVEIEIGSGFEEGGAGELADGGGGAGGEDEVVGKRVLKGEPHASDEFWGVSPIALGVEISEFEDFVGAMMDAGDGGGDFPSDETFAAAWRFVVVEDAVDDVHAMGLPIDAAEIGRECLGTAVGIYWPERGLLGLWEGLGDSENFRRGGVKKPWWGGEITADFQESECGDGGFGDGGLGDLKAEADVGLASEVVEFIRLDAGEEAAERGLIAKVGVVEFEWFPLLSKVFDAGAVELAGAPEQAMHRVALFQ